MYAVCGGEAVSATARVTFTCDNCGYEVTNGGEKPEGWSAYISRPWDGWGSTPTTYTSGGYFGGNPTYCKNCIDAAEEAMRKALADRKALSHVRGQQ